MATLSTEQLTLADWAKRLDPKGNVADIAEILSQQNQVHEEMVMVEANGPMSHTVTVRSGLPTVYWRLMNAGTPSSKSTTAQVVEPCAMLEARSAIDLKELQMNNNSAAFRLSEETPFIESMSQEVAGKIFNGNRAVDPKTFTGLATRYSSTTAGNGQNVLLAGGSGSDNASVYLVNWHTSTCFGTFPAGSTAGLTVQDLGPADAFDASGNRYRAALTLFQQDIGLVVKDWRNVVRIANIDVSDVLGVTGTQATTAATNITTLMLRAMARIPNIGMGKPAFYANRTVAESLMIQAKSVNQQYLGIEKATNQFGNSILQLTFLGIPVRIVDQLGVAETLVS